jgi:hypothetical protein
MGFDFKAFKTQQPAYADLSDEDAAVGLYLNEYRHRGVTQEKFLSAIDMPDLQQDLRTTVAQYDYSTQDYNPVDDLLTLGKRLPSTVWRGISNYSSMSLAATTSPEALSDIAQGMDKDELYQKYIVPELDKERKNDPDRFNFDDTFAKVGDNPFGLMLNLPKKILEDVGSEVSGALRSARAGVRNMINKEDEKAVQLEYGISPAANVIEKIVESGAPSLYMSMTAAYLTKNPTVGIALMSHASGSETLFQEIEKKSDPKVAAALYGIHSVAEGVGESLTFPGIFKAGTQGTTGRELVKLMFENAMQEGATGWVQNGSTLYFDKIADGMNPQQALEESAAEGLVQTPEEMMIGAGTAVMGGAPGLAGQSRQNKIATVRKDRIERLKALKLQLTEAGIEQVKKERAERIPTTKKPPVVAFHGTTQESLEGIKKEGFDFERTGDEQPADFGAGAYLSSSEEAAGKYAEEAGGDAVGRFELDLQNPAKNADLETHDAQLALDSTDHNPDALKNYLMAKGFDGIEYTRANGDIEYTIFDAAQAKIAEDNQIKQAEEQIAKEKDEIDLQQWLGMGTGRSNVAVESEEDADLVALPHATRDKLPIGLVYDANNATPFQVAALAEIDLPGQIYLYHRSFGIEHAEAFALTEQTVLKMLQKSPDALEGPDGRTNRQGVRTYLGYQLERMTRNGQLEIAGTNRNGDPNYALTMKGQGLADLIEQGPYLKMHSSQADAKQLSRQEYREINEYIFNNGLNTDQAIEYLYEKGVLSEVEHEIYKEVKDILSPRFFEGVDINFMSQPVQRPDLRGQHGAIPIKQYMDGINDVITLYSARDAKTFIHEIGHHAMWRLLSIEDTENAYAIYKQSDAYNQAQLLTAMNKPAGNYSFSEWFAESFGQHVLNRVQKSSAKKSEMGGIFDRFSYALGQMWQKVQAYIVQEKSMRAFMDNLIDRGDAAHADTTQQREQHYWMRNLREESPLNFDQDQQAYDDSLRIDPYQSDLETKIPTYEEMSYDTLITRAESGDINAQKELDFRISQFETTPVRDKERKELLNGAHQVERSTGLDSETIAKAKKGLFGKDSMTWMTNEEIKQYKKEIKRLAEIVNDPKHAYNMATTESGLDSKTIDRFNKASNNNQTAVAMILNKRKMLGGYADDSEIMKRQIDRDITNTKILTKWDAKVQQAMEKKNQEKNFINQWVSMRYAMNLLDLRSGFPIYQLFEKINEESVLSEYAAVKEIQKLLAEPGKYTGESMSFEQVAHLNLQSPLINKALFEENEEARDKLFNQLTPKQKDLYYKMHQLLQGDAANQIREVRWWEWNRARLHAEQAPTKSEYTKRSKVAEELLPYDLKDNEAEQKRILKEGREAMAQNKLSEWIAGENFGTREYYFPSENKNSSTVLSDLLGIPEASLQDTQKRGMQKMSLREERGRKGKSLARTQPVLQVVLNHYRRALLRNATKSESVQMNEMLKQVDLSTRDIGHLNNWMSNVLGKPMGATSFTRAAEWVNNKFWRNYGVHLSKILHFVGRNILQSSWLLGQQNVGDVLQSAMRVWSGHATENTKRAFKERWISISQKGAITEEQMALGQASERSQTRTFRNRVSHRYSQLQQFANRLMPFSDTMNRLTIYPILHETAQRYGQKYMNNKVSFNKLRRKLGLDTLSLGQTEKLEQLLAKGDVDNFAHYLAQYKTENTQFKYGRTERSMLEQTRGGRAVMGLATYPRGVFELLWNGSAIPFFKGIKELDVRQGWQAVYQGVSTVVLSRIAMELARGVMGDRDKEDYGWLTLTGFTFLSPGAGILYDLTSEAIPQLSNIAGQVISGDKKKEDAVDDVANLFSRYIEIMIPMSDVMINSYQATNDTQGMNLWKTARSLLDKSYARKYKRRHKYRREDLDQLQLVFFGGNRTDNERENRIDRMNDQEKAAYFLTGARPKE